MQWYILSHVSHAKTHGTAIVCDQALASCPFIPVDGTVKRDLTVPFCAIVSKQSPYWLKTSSISARAPAQDLPHLQTFAIVPGTPRKCNIFIADATVTLAFQ